MVSANIGRDTSKFFYGSYKMENFDNRTRPYEHSSLASDLANSLAIARLTCIAPIFLARLNSNYKIYNSTSIFVLKADSELNKDYKRSKLIPFIHKMTSNCISEIGKYYLLRIMKH